MAGYRVRVAAQRQAGAAASDHVFPVRWYFDSYDCPSPTLQLLCARIDHPTGKSDITDINDIWFLNKD